MNVRWPVRSVLAGTAGTAALSNSPTSPSAVCAPVHRPGPLEHDDSSCWS